MGKLDDSEYGQADFNNGEMHLSAHLSDPVAYRGNKKAADVGSGSTAIVFFGADIRRSDNVKECIAMMIGRADDRYPIGHEGTQAAGEWEWFVRKPGMGSTDQAMVRQMRVRHDGIEVWDHSRQVYVPLLALAGWTPSPDAPPPAPPIPQPSGEPLTLAPGTLLRLDGGASIVSGVTPTPAPVPPPQPAPDPEPQAHAVAFNWRGQPWIVEPGDFSTLQRIFGFALDRSDVEEFHRTQNWQAVVDLYIYKSQGDE